MSSRGKGRRPNAYLRAHAWARNHPRARLMEFLFFAIPGGLAIALAIVLHQVDVMTPPIALILGIVGLSYAAFGLLPSQPEKKEDPVNPRSLRGQRVQQR